MNPVELEQKLVELGARMASTKAIALSREHGLKAIRATAYADARAKSLSQGDAEQAAYASKAYRDGAEEYAKAVERAEIAKVEYQAMLTKFQAWRTMSATRRAEMQLT